MMINNANIIKQTTLNFRFHQPENKFAIPGKVENWFLHRALNEINLVCDELAKEGEYLEIDTIEIDLGCLTGRQFEFESAQLFKEKLRGKMKAVLAEKRDCFSFGHEKRDRSAGVATIFFDFLTKGYLPWQSSFVSISQMEAEIRSRLDADEPIFWEQIISLISLGSVQKRLAFNFSPTFVQWLIKKILGHLSLQAWPAVSAGRLDSLENKESALKQLGKQLSTHTSGPAIKEKQKAILDLKKKNEMSFDDSKLIKTEWEMVAEGIFIANAGLMLLHPFLPALFTNLGLTSDNSFINDRETEKAVWLLHYLVYGHLELDESQVVLPKLICRMPLEYPLKYIPVLSSEEKNEVDILIEQAIRHWAILKNTSIASFRETFLQREGRVHVYDTFIEIDVEQKAVDMLIGHLPWALSRIILPWMDKKFHVNWA